MKHLLFILFNSLLLIGCGSTQVQGTNSEKVKSDSSDQSIEAAIKEQQQIGQSDNVAVGTWETKVESPRGTQNSTLVITEENGKLKGKTDNGAFIIKQNGNTYSWSSAMNTPMGSMQLQNEVKIEGNVMTGTVKMNSGPMAGRSMSITGKRK